MIGLDFRITFRIAVEKKYLSSLKGLLAKESGKGWAGVKKVF